MLDLYYHLHDEDSQQAMLALAGSLDHGAADPIIASLAEGNLRATGGSTIEKTPQAPETQELVAHLNSVTERMGFEPMVRFPVHTLDRHRVARLGQDFVELHLGHPFQLVAKSSGGTRLSNLRFLQPA